MPNQALNAAQELKMGTVTAHQELEAWLSPRISGLETNQELADILLAFYFFLKPLEPKISDYITPGLLPDLSQRGKIHLLEESLASFNLGGEAPKAVETPPVNSVQDALGIMYVLEGSTLGGKSIVRMLTSNPNLQLAPAQYHYFNPYGENTGQMWKTFQVALNNAVRDENELQTVIHAANETFRCLKQTLIKHLSR